MTLSQVVTFFFYWRIIIMLKSGDKVIRKHPVVDLSGAMRKGGQYKVSKVNSTHVTVEGVYDYRGPHRVDYWFDKDSFEVIL
jgi:hypothetical protein